MEDSNLDVLSILITELLKYLGCCRAVQHNLLRKGLSSLRSVCKVKSSGDCVLPFREQGEQNVRLCMDRSIILNAVEACEDFPRISKDWIIPISTCEIVDSALHLSFNRTEAFRQVIQDVIKQGENYGRTKCQNYARIRFFTKSEEHITDLSAIRVTLAGKVVGNLLKAAGYEVEVNPTETGTRKPSLDLYFTHKSTDVDMPPGSTCVPCGVVLNADTGCKEKELTACDYYRQWEEAIFKAYQEKYDAVTKEQLDIENQIARAGVLFDLLGIKLSNCVSLTPLSHQETHTCYGVNSKGAPFILYNTARLANIGRHFQENVQSGKYPELPPFEQIHTCLLTYEEEWTLLLNYIMRFPLLIKESLIGCDKGKPNVHVFVVFLNDFCRKISVYYRRVRILTDSRSQLLPTMYARLYLLQSIEQVLHNALSILGIRPILQM